MDDTMMNDNAEEEEMDGMQIVGDDEEDMEDEDGMDDEDEAEGSDEEEEA